jgi:hypothetical protein
VGDLFLVFCAVAANTNAAPICSDNNTDGASYALLGTADYASTVPTSYMLSCFVRTALLLNTTSTVVTVATGSNTAGEIIVLCSSGYLRANVSDSAIHGWRADDGPPALPGNSRQRHDRVCGQQHAQGGGDAATS